MLERMDSFFNCRVEGYEEHQLNAIDCAREFYPFTADCLPGGEGARVLDLGCGTGLELGYYFEVNPTARIVGIDMAGDMLEALGRKFPDKDLKMIQGSYFDIPFEENGYDAAVSVESLHHFTQAEKLPLYRKVFQALEPGGYFILTDYFASSEEEELFHRQELLRLKAEQGIKDDAFYHYDAPLTVGHEIQALKEAGFLDVKVLRRWGATHTIKADRGFRQE